MHRVGTDIEGRTICPWDLLFNELYSINYGGGFLMKDNGIVGEMIPTHLVLR